MTKGQGSRVRRRRPEKDDGIDPDLKPILDLIAEELTAEYLRLLRDEGRKDVEALRPEGPEDRR